MKNHIVIHRAWGSLEMMKVEYIIKKKKTKKLTI